MAARAAAHEAVRLAKAGRLEEAIARAARSVEGSTVCLPGHGLLASLLIGQGRRDDARRVTEEAAGLGNGDADACDGLAAVSMALGEHDRANLYYRLAAQLAPAEARFWYNLACSERSLGRLEEAEAACSQAIARDAAQYPSYLLRSEMRVQEPGANHIAELEALLEQRAQDYRAQVFLGYALAKEHDDLGHYDQAFRRFAAAAKARRARLSYDVAVDEAKLRRIAQVYTPARCTARLDAAAADTPVHIFIVGLPRSGTTLVERILSGLPGVHSNGETDNFWRALLPASEGIGEGAGDLFERAAAADPHAVAANYQRLARGPAGSIAVIEKLPLNFLYLGAICRALPAAKLILVRRSPIDSCFAMFRTLFGTGYPFSYDLTELARYYAAFEGLVDHWRRVLGSHLHEVNYENLVREPRTFGALIAHHCGLAWSDAAIDIQNNRAASLTASAAQVRRPIYGSSSGRWRHYRAHLEPLVAALREHGVAAPD